MLSPLPPESLAGHCDPGLIPYEATDKAPSGPRVVGQARAMDALAYGLSRADQHLFVAAPPGAGCLQILQRVAAEATSTRAAAADVCYVFDVEAPLEPALLLLPPGAGPRLRRAIEELLEDIEPAIETALDSRDTISRTSEIEREFSDRREDAEGDAARLAAWARERRKRRRALIRSVTRRVVEEAFGEMRRRERLPDAAEPFISAVMIDLIESAGDPLISERAFGRASRRRHSKRPGRHRYAVNVMATTNTRSGTPVVVEDDPSPERLFGWIDSTAHSGARTAPHLAVRPGALHRAHGGILLLNAAQVLGHAEVWTPLRSAMKIGTFRPIVPENALMTGPLSSPAPSPFAVQLVMVGDASLYSQHADDDEEFNDLFHVYVDFDATVPATPENVSAHSLLIADLVKEDGLKPVRRDAVARVLEHAMRLAGDRKRLSMKTSQLRGVLREADYVAGPSARQIESTHVEQAVIAARSRTRRPADQVMDDIVRDMMRIDTDGVRVGQVNGIIVGTSGGLSYAHPACITARVRLGEGDVVDIEREVEFGGAAHSKGVLILSGFMGGRYAPDRPLSLAASLVFEQSYAGIDGDSASAAELACLLSAIGEIPVAQSLAVTGSVNQHGELQAVGDVTEKIEGFFDVCAARGLTGAHGVVIPFANLDHLNLAASVVRAVAANRFHVYTAHTIDDVLAALSGLPAGDRNHHGRFPDGSFNALVERRLLAFAEERKAYRVSDEEDDG
jgi:lon-related putative ATP-dependent protease